jgi:hypothetical protein
MLDIAIAIFIGVLTLTTAFLGIYVTLHPAGSDRAKLWYKLGFLVCGLFGCALIGVQTARNNQAQNELKSQLGRIEKNTVEPPKVQVNLPQVVIPPPQVIFQGKILAAVPDKSAPTVSLFFSESLRIPMRQREILKGENILQVQRDMLQEPSNIVYSLKVPLGQDLSSLNGNIILRNTAPISLKKALASVTCNLPVKTKTIGGHEFNANQFSVDVSDLRSFRETDMEDFLSFTIDASKERRAIVIVTITSDSMPTQIASVMGEFVPATR